MTSELELPVEYHAFLNGLKRQVRDAQSQAHRLVNTRLIELYWDIGAAIRQRQRNDGWGAQIIRRLADDLARELPDMKGLSRRNLQYMTTMAVAWPDPPIAQQAVAQLPWGHITVLLDKLDDQHLRDWYAEQPLAHGWSRNVLLNQIKNNTHARVGSAPSNFRSQLAPADSDLAQQVAKDPYVFDFLDLTGEVAERQLEQALMDRLVHTLQELGAGFAFVGRQVHFDVDGDDFYVDLLFFHFEQLRYVVVELKSGKFQPEFAGKLGFYVVLVDDKLRRPTHAPTVGILLCSDRNEQTVQ